MAREDPADTVVDTAREAFERGDHVFQYTESASLEPDGFTEGYYGRPFKPVQQVSIPNGICRAGWELVNGSVSRWESGNSVYMVGFYLFRRCEANRRPPDGPARRPASTVAETSTPPPPAGTAEAARQDAQEPVAPGLLATSMPSPVDRGGRIPGAGWYEDPAAPPGRFQRRWWDGSAWTERTDQM